MTQFDGMSPSALKAWGLLAKAYPDLAVTSAFRDPEHNARVGGAKNSQHMHGNAFDVNTAGWTEEQRQAFVAEAMRAGFSGFGNYENSMHVDTGPARVWGPSYGADTAPEWLTSAAVGGGAVNTPFNPPEGVLFGVPDDMGDAMTNAAGLLASAYSAPAAPQIAPMQAAPVERSRRTNPYAQFFKSLG